MRVLVVLGAALAALAVAPLASSGGWATVGFEPPPDDGMSAGGDWHPTIFVKQHGITPMTGLHPVVEIYDETGGTETFTAIETSEAGVYEADVTFPSEGEWRVVIHSGFGDSQVTYGPVTIGAPSGGGDGIGELPVVGIGAALLVLAGGVAFLVARRSRRLTPASG